jgi:hypothetical protein
LGAGRNDAEDVKNHAYFKDVNWDDVYHKKYVPDFIPELNNEFDLKYFDKFFTQQDIIDEQNEILLMKDEEMLNNEANLNKINCNHNITGHKNKNNLGKDEEKEKDPEPEKERVPSELILMAEGTRILTLNGSEEIMKGLLKEDLRMLNSVI